MTEPIHPASEPSDAPDELAGPEPGERSRRGLLVAGAAAGLVGLVAAGAWAVNSFLGLGDRPEAAVPADVVAFLRLDLDPKATEKVDALRFLRQFDGLADELPDEDADLRRWFVEQSGEDVDYARDIEPWLGERFGLAVLPGLTGDGEPLVAGVLAVTDEDEARAGLGRLAEGEDGPVFLVRDGWAYVAADQAALDAAAAEEGDRLADSAAFGRALEAVGDEAIAMGYVDLARLAELVGEGLERDATMAGTALGAAGAPDLTALSENGGQVSFGVQFEPDAVELKAALTGSTGMVVADVDEATLLSSLPETTLVGVQAAGAGDSVVKQWDQVLDQLSSLSGTAGARAPDDSEAPDRRAQVDEQIAAFEDETGIALPDDLGVLLGESLLVGVEGEGVDSGRPSVAAVVKTDAQRAKEVADILVGLAADSGADVDSWNLETEADGDLFRIGTSAAYLSGLGQEPGSSLGAVERFDTAVPGADEAQLAVWLDLDRAAELLGEEASAAGGDAETRQALEVLDAFGMSAVVQDESSATFTLRLTTD